MDMVEKARMVATWAHRDQTDIAGKPYILHPEAVARRVSEGGQRVESVAWLHDVVEDSPITLDDLRELGFPWVVVDAVDAITQRREADGSHEDLYEYWARVKQNPIALTVKYADIAENNSPERQYYLPPERVAKLRAKYARALEFLNAPT